LKFIQRQTFWIQRGENSKRIRHSFPDRSFPPVQRHPPIARRVNVCSWFPRVHFHDCFDSSFFKRHGWLHILNGLSLIFLFFISL
jgi:hypothetical protein